MIQRINQMTTKFTKENLIGCNGYVFFHKDGRETAYVNREFVARFKYVKRNMGPFMTFLRKNFTVEEYFDRYDAGETPLAIVKSKGYIASHIKAEMKRAGYPRTLAGHTAWWAAECVKIDAHMAKTLADPAYQAREAVRNAAVHANSAAAAK
jgi:hypothetical protein